MLTPASVEQVITEIAEVLDVVITPADRAKIGKILRAHRDEEYDPASNRWLIHDYVYFDYVVHIYRLAGDYVAVVRNGHHNYSIEANKTLDDAIAAAQGLAAQLMNYAK